MAGFALRRGLAAHLPAATCERLAKVKVGIAGAGGLGSNVAMLLARSGIGRFVLVDGDKVEESNLNRQFFWPQDVGRSKVYALRDRLLGLEPLLELEVVNAFLAPQDAPRLFAGCHAVIEALDDAALKRKLCESLLAAGFFVVAASGLAGTGSTGGMMERRMLGSRFVCVGDFSSAVDAATPALAPRVMQAAAMQADAVLEHILLP